MAFWSALISPPSRAPLVARPSLMLFYLLAGAFILTLVPHVIQFPIWLSAIIVGAMVLRCFIESYRLPLPSTTFSSIVAIILLGAIILQYGHIMGRDAGTAFTAGLLTIKFYELRRPRDVSLIIFSCFFMVMSALLYSQAVELFIYCMIMMWVLTALLTRVHTGDLPQDALLRMLQKSGFIFLQALPLALFLFFFFPRYSGTLGLRFDEASIGLNDTVTPGSISKLSENDTKAMYVQFAPGANVPTTDSMYWRALVLWHYSRGAWTQGSVADEGAFLPVEFNAKPDEIRQTITVEAHHKRWLFALDVPSSLPFNETESQNWAIATKSHVVSLAYGYGNLDHIARYTVNSVLTPVEEDLGATEQLASVQLPEEENDKIAPDVRALADKLHQGLSEDQVQEYSNAVIHYFRHGGFVYSAEPGAQGPDWLSIFLFKSHKGFCEHFASAFAVLMRLGGVHARLVIGYQGAEYNPYQDTYTIYQADAHAWDEIWIPDKSQPLGGVRGYWKRIDPVFLMVQADAPGEKDKDNAREQGLIQKFAQDPGFLDRVLPGWAQNAIKEIKLRRDEVEINWDNVVLSYTPEAQGRLAQALGFGEKASVGLFFTCLIATGVCLFIFRKLTTRKAAISPVEKLYATFCRNMTQRGVPRAMWEGPLAYTHRVADAFPDDKPAIERVGAIVARIRYGPLPFDPALQEKLQETLTQISASNATASSRERR